METEIPKDKIGQELDVSDETGSSGDIKSGVETERLLERTTDETRKQLSTTHRYTFRITGDESRKCITGSMVCLPDDRIVISDFQWYQLKVFDEDYNFCFSTTCFPGARIAHYSANEIILTNTDLHKVMFYAIEKNRITELPKTIPLNHKAYALQYGNNHFGVLMNNNSFFISIFNEMGTEIGSLRKHLSVEELPEYFVMDQSEQKVYTCNQDRCEIVCSSYSDEVLFRVPLMYKYVPYGIILVEKVIVVAVNPSHVIAIVKTDQDHEIYDLIEKPGVVPQLLALQPKRKCILIAVRYMGNCELIRSHQITAGSG